MQTVYYETTKSRGAGTVQVVTTSKAYWDAYGAVDDGSPDCVAIEQAMMACGAMPYCESEFTVNDKNGEGLAMLAAAMRQRGYDMVKDRSFSAWLGRTG